MSGSISIKNGTDGLTPVVGVEEDTDGLYYWTIDSGSGNSTWLLDESGNKIKANGIDGYTPTIGVMEYENETYWTLDGEWLVDASGNKIPTTGADGTDGVDAYSIFDNIIFDDTSVTFNLSNGSSISVPCMIDFICITNAGTVIEYDRVMESLNVPFTCSFDQCSSIIAKVSNSTYNSVDIYTKTASTDTNWGVEIDESSLTIKLEAPVMSDVDDTALLELMAISNTGVTYTSSAVIKVISSTGLPSSKDNAEEPTIDPEDITIETLPSAVFNVDDTTHIMTISMTGIQSLVNSLEFVKLYGSGESDQNVWLSIDNNLVGFSVSNGNEETTISAKADLIFLVDNSGSMSQEANTVATQLLDWSSELSKVMDVQFACVGYAETAISGAIDLTDVSTVSTYLSRTTGTSRTKGYADNVSSEATSAASSYTSTGECGAMAAKFADKYFTFRSGANRIYVNLTDEPNFHSSSHYEWSVEAFNVNAVSPYSYSWSSDKGTIHTVISDNGSYSSSYTSYKENPALMSTYTGGTSLTNVNSSYTGVDLSDLPVTGAILNSYLFKVDFTPNLNSGTHVLTIKIYDPTTGVYADYDFDIIF